MPMSELPNETPLPTHMSDLVAKEVKDKPEGDDASGDTRHCAECFDISGLGNPRIGVKGEEETEGSCWAQLSQYDVASSCRGEKLNSHLKAN